MSNIEQGIMTIEGKRKLFMGNDRIVRLNVQEDATLGEVTPYTS